jgi:uncharacterized protein
MKKSLIWSFQTDGTSRSNREGTQTPNYLIGTMHVRDERAFQFENGFKQAIEKCEIFATEFNLDEAQSGAVQMSLFLPENESLKTLMSTKLYEKINANLLKKMGVSLEQFDRFKPITVTNFLTESLLSKDRWLSLDETLWEFAKEKGKILRGIETFEEQLAVLEKMPLADQVKNLKDTMHDLSNFKKQLTKMADYYEHADIVKLYKSAKKSAKGSRKLLLYNRNAIMANRIMDLVQENSVCVAIGAGHLAGEKGVIRLLKKKGLVFKVVIQ